MKENTDINQMLSSLESALDFSMSNNFGLDELLDALANVKKTGDIEKDMNTEASAILKAFKQRHKDESNQKMAALDSNYWFCVCFQTREQKDAFLKAVKWFEHGDKYLDGQFVAKKLGVSLPPVKLKFNERTESKLVKEIKTIRNLRKKGE